MTGRKPPHMSFQEWVDMQERAAERDRQFQNLPGTGKPLPDWALDSSENAILASMLRRQDVDVTFALPPALALAKEVEVLADQLDGEHKEAAVRARLENLNDRIRAAHRTPTDGLPLRVMPLDVEAQLDSWRCRAADRAAERAARAAASAPAADSVQVPRRRRFALGRRRGR